MTRRQALLLAAAFALLAGGVVARLVVGGDMGDPNQRAQVLALRGIRAESAVLVGACLGVAGALLQAFLRNPLASPDLLGLASGSGLGIMLSAYAGYLAGHGVSMAGPAATPAAIAGALGALGLVYAFAQRRGIIDPVSLVLVGVVVGMIGAALAELVRHLMPDQATATFNLLLGTIREDVRRSEIGVAWFVLALSTLGGIWAGPWIDAATLSEDEARSVGVPMGWLRLGLFVASGALSACAVVLAGPVGFVGLVAPHAVRWLAGPAHRWLVPGSALVGALIVVWADVGIRLVELGSGRLPLGAVTPLLGGPVLVMLLRQHQRGRF